MSPGPQLAPGLPVDPAAQRVGGALPHVPAPELALSEVVEEELTAADVHEAAKRYLDTKNYVKVILYPKTEVAGTEE